MKTLHNHIILYDADCPMCKLYTNSLVNRGMLNQDGRAAYQNIPHAACPLVDWQRAANEIALVNTQTGEVSYGIESLFKVIGYNYTWLKPMFNCVPFLWLAKKLYAFVSYNRRVIIPASKADEYAVQPTFRLSYRLAYLVFTWLLAGGILTMYAKLLTGLVPLGDHFREYYICGGQILFQTIIINWYAPQKRWEYLGNMMTISFGGALLLLPALLMAQIFHFSAIAATFCFLGVAGLMFLEHIRRTKILHLGWLLTLSWTVYRLLVLLLIYILN
ncbi:thiol-disulfide oxidoreductase DCC family protein [Mucilaginibacter segetis]|uniref:DUF393 domain-containing protein n=1 Tax=Mucilaginibacter segetis TaxID=2793071 RepID=A0A934PSS0_9SPHI|nr:DUF393 domain-containing protein [Mucilaginibacter segetis]MBK0378837.1 DUF393 domain-containing protein [Mucilaginibacter segetis]